MRTERIVHTKELGLTRIVQAQRIINGRSAWVWVVWHDDREWILTRHYADRSAKKAAEKFFRESKLKADLKPYDKVRYHGLGGAEKTLEVSSMPFAEKGSELEMLILVREIDQPETEFQVLVSELEKVTSR